MTLARSVVLPVYIGSPTTIPLPVSELEEREKDIGEKEENEMMLSVVERKEAKRERKERRWDLRDRRPSPPSPSLLPLPSSSSPSPLDLLWPDPRSTDLLAIGIEDDEGEEGEAAGSAQLEAEPAAAARPHRRHRCSRSLLSPRCHRRSFLSPARKQGTKHIVSLVFFFRNAARFVKWQESARNPEREPARRGSTETSCAGDCGAAACSRQMSDSHWFRPSESPTNITVFPFIRVKKSAPSNL
uniref:Uncharacterized protein n=1 Tax=Oryza nivara TaxID=4536 RepID=A0A0E0GL30_ORYNI